MPHRSIDATSAPGSLATADEAALAGVLSLSPDAILVVDATGRIRAANELATELLGHDAHELVGQPVEVLVPEESRSGHGSYLAAFMARPIQRPMGSGQLLRAQRGDGSCFPADVSLQPVDVAGEQLVVVAVRDLSRQRQLQRRNHELEEHAEALGRFVDVASHELRTPLSAVRGFAETLQRPGLTAPEQQAVLHGLLRNTRRQQALIDDLLDLSRLRHGASTPELQPVDLAALLTRLADDLDDGQVDVGVVPEVEVLAEPRSLERIFVNLLSNAHRYGRAPICIAAAPTSGPGQAPGVQISVCDQGPGVAPDFEQRLFTPFSQQSTGDTREAAGLGLGLYLSHQWATAMGGDLRYRPNLPTGACFELVLTAAPSAR